MSKFIESLTKPSKTPTRKVICFGTEYEFAPVLKGRFIATVADERAIEAFLTKPKLYREVAATELTPSAASAASAAATSSLSKAKPATEAPKEPEPVNEAEAKPEEAKADASETAGEIQRQAQALLASTPNAIKKQLEKHCPELDVLKAAYAIEKADPKARPLVVSGLKAAIDTKEAE